MDEQTLAVQGQASILSCLFRTFLQIELPIKGRTRPEPETPLKVVVIEVWIRIEKEVEVQV